MYTDENLNFLYEENKCKNNHDLKWTGQLFLNTPNISCSDCKQTQLNDPIALIRWECLKCNEFYCQKCRPISKYFKCPNYHNYIANSENGVVSLPIISFTCDLCFLSDKDISNIYIDKTCNITFCKNCIGDKESFIYFIRED